MNVDSSLKEYCFFYNNFCWFPTK